MHFLDIIRTVRRESGGPAEGLRRILEGYRTMGHTAEVLTLDPPGSLPDDLDVPVHALGRSIHGYGYSTAARTWLRANASRFDGIVVQGLWQYQGLLTLQELAGRHSYAVFTHGMLDPWFNREYPLKYVKKLPYWALIERRVLRGAHRVLFTATMEAKLAAESFPFSRWTPQVVPYGTAGPSEDAEAQVAAFFDTVDLAPGEPFLLYAGRIHEKKGCDLLIEAYSIVAQEAALPRLVMAGPDQVGLAATLQRVALRRGVADRFLWPGMISGAAKWGAFRAADAFVLPSHQENFGIAVAEALSCGTPALISDQVNIHADIANCNAGLCRTGHAGGHHAPAAPVGSHNSPGESGHAAAQRGLLARSLQQRRNIPRHRRHLFTAEHRIVLSTSRPKPSTSPAERGFAKGEAVRAAGVRVTRQCAWHAASDRASWASRAAACRSR